VFNGLKGFKKPPLRPPESEKRKNSEKKGNSERGKTSLELAGNKTDKKMVRQDLARRGDMWKGVSGGKRGQKNQLKKNGKGMEERNDCRST